MDAVFCGRSHNGARIAVRTAEGYIGAEAIDDCDFEIGAAVFGVTRDHGTQHWHATTGSQCEVYVEGVGGSREWIVRWLAGG